MRRLTILRPSLLLPLAFAACHDRARAPAAPSPDAAHVVKEAARPRPLPPRAHAALRRIARREMDRQGEIRLPGAFPDALTRLVPKSLAPKLIQAEVFRHMRLAKPAPGRRAARLVWLTLAEPPTARPALRARLETEGWLAAGAPLRRVLRKGVETLQWSERATPDAPTRIELIWEGASDPAPPEPLAALSPRAPKALLGLHVDGYEYGQYHAVQPGVGFTDVERFTVLVRASDAAAAEAIRVKLGEAVKADGYVVSGRDPHLYRQPDGRTLNTRMAGAAAGDLIIHHQRRWKRSLVSPRSSSNPDK